MNKFEQNATMKTLPEIKTSRSQSLLFKEDQFHSRPDEKDYKMIPSVFLPLEGGPVVVFGNMNNSGANTDRTFKSRAANKSARASKIR